MKKFVAVFMALALLTGCSQGEGTDNNSNIQAENQENAENNIEGTSDEIVFDRDDFVLMAPNEEDSPAIIWLGMEENDLSSYMAEFADYYSGITYSLARQHRVENGKYTDEIVNYIDLISYTGSREYLETAKGIHTGGLYETASKENSTLKDIISAYGIDEENEEFIIKEQDSFESTAVLYFNIDNHNKVMRIKPEKGSDISNIENIRGADYFIKFMLIDDSVVGIQFYRQKEADADRGE